MAQTDKDFLTRLADRGEQVVGRITDLPGAKTLVDKTAALAKNVDAMAAIERRLDKLEGKGTTTRKRTTTRKSKPKTPPSSSTGSSS